MKKNRNQVQGKNTCKFWLLIRSFLIISLLSSLASCFQSKKIPKSSDSSLDWFLKHSKTLNKYHVGIIVKELNESKIIFEKDSEKFFIPASNIKILTLHAALNLLPDTLDAYKYTIDSLNRFLIRPLGYPALLHPDFMIWDEAFSFLKNVKLDILLDTSNWHASRYGKGWMWDDFSYAYSAERSAFPIYGNTYLLFPNIKAKWNCFPYDFSKKNRQYAQSRRVRRDPFSSTINIPNVEQHAKDTITIPVFHPNIFTELFLTDTLNQAIIRSNLSHIPPQSFSTIKGCPRDTVLRSMMYNSDNFLAEQLLLMCAAQRKGDTLMQHYWFTDTLFIDNILNARWVDGSGLSRYNLLLPKEMASLLEKMWEEEKPTYLLSFFPAGGGDGTFKHSFKGIDGKPYVYAKSGSMSGVYCLSGYLNAKSGKWLSFSIMVNGFVGTSTPIKKDIAQLLEKIYQEK